jgi:flagellar protein FliS
MFTYTHNAAKHYAMINLESNALVADPHKLISMLFEGAVIALNQSEFDIENGKLVDKCTSISKAIDIISFVEYGCEISIDVLTGARV